MVLEELNYALELDHRPGVPYRVAWITRSGWAHGGPHCPVLLRLHLCVSLGSLLNLSVPERLIRTLEIL